ncbi:YdeI/OmpD-associated family protein [Rufibacter quisquiliarum]|uniref:Uncharacterized protein YdeI (YjbR/CyaY-like superfamily) n=1 Tax=Rufibacter quisquiliarum TaxID=1549639 RepID=A0A839GHB7_9BACT|nr:DUF1801 domain-containing protein [Rufibacter quisquiliarum]MBA9077980.1 uncharacterized protein YdeI (YjbR/CyaY-like superfamily) [Rufibacter quisquiliarum]
MNPQVDKYLLDGCMRCPYGGTPQCKVHTWQAELVLLRHLALESGLTEEVKWGVPCYTLGSKNIFMVTAFKHYAAINFFKGVLLKDEARLLTAHGESSQSARSLRFTSPDQVLQQQEVIKQYLQEAIDIEKAGLKVAFKKNLEPVPDELLATFEEHPDLQHAFYRLTPGRQRGYVLFFSQPKQTQTRFSRIARCREKILQGMGLHD